jgi:hypothetical protein
VLVSGSPKIDLCDVVLLAVDLDHEADLGVVREGMAPEVLPGLKRSPRVVGVLSGAIVRS